MKEKKSFHTVRTFRVSDNTFESLERIKKKTKGTWNYLFIKLLKKYENKNTMHNM